MTTIYVDADGCPVKEEVYRVARRYTVPVFVVANASLRVPTAGGVESVVVPGGPDEADHWIAEKIGEGDIAITTDIPLAERCLAKGARVLSPKGRAWTAESIGSALASREILGNLRQAGAITGGPAPFSAADRSRFLSALDTFLVAALKGQAPRRPPPPF